MAEKEKNQEDSGQEQETHVSEYKKKVVKDLVKLMKENPIVGAINMEGMPASALQSMRSQLRDQVTIRMTKRRVMKYAFEQVKPEKKGIEDLVPHLKGMPALLFTEENPFKLFKVIKKNKTPAPAKPGQEAPKDIAVSAGATPFAPGPVIGELGALGIKTEVKDGKIHIKEDAVIVKEGEEIDEKTAGMLTRLGIEPMEVGLDLVAVYEDGMIYDKKVLDIDEEAFEQDLQNAARWAFNLAVEAGHFTKETVNVLVPKAFREAKGVALEGNVMNDITREEIIAKAERQMVGLKTEANIPDHVPEEKADAPAEEKKEESKEPEAEKKEEPSEESKPEEKPAGQEEKKEEAPAAEPEKEEKPANEEEEESGKDAEQSQKGAEEKREELEKKEEEVKEDLKEIKEEVKEESEHPDPEHIKEMEKEVDEAEEKLEKIEEEKKDLPSTEKIILDAIDKNKEKEEIKGDETPAKEKKEAKQERKIDPEKKKQAEESEKLFEELKKKGTLRDEDKKIKGPKTPEEIISEAHKK